MNSPSSAAQRSGPCILGFNFKQYFDFDQTSRWISQFSDIVRTARQNAGEVELFVLPSYPALPMVRALLAGTGVSIGAQDVSTRGGGPFTGEVDAATLRQVGCRYVLIGHAERRSLFGDTDAVVATKFGNSVAQGLTPIVCVGETRRARVTAVDRCVSQIDSLLDAAAAPGRMVVAYEPLWAIGAPSPAPVSHIVEVCSALRQYLQEVRPGMGDRVMYGGSAGPGMLTDVASAVDGLFLGRRVHDPLAFAAVLEEAAGLAGPRSCQTL